VKDPTSQLRSATRRAKSDVANKIVSMFLHELSRRIAENWRVRIGDEEYEKVVRKWFKMAMHLTHVATIDCGIDGLCAVIPARQW